MILNELTFLWAQCLHEEETQAVLLRKKGPVRRRSVPGRALYPDLLSERTRLRSFESGKTSYPGSVINEFLCSTFCLAWLGDEM